MLLDISEIDISTRKTQIALDLAYQHRQSHNVFWIHGATQQYFTKNYVGIAKEVGLPQAADNTKEGEICSSVKRWLESKESGPWLLIIDNADDKTTAMSIRSMLPIYRGTVVFTTRNSEVATTVVNPKYRIRLEIMTKLEARTTFLNLACLTPEVQQNQDPLKQDPLSCLLEALGYLPLAIAQAAAYILETGTSIEEYSHLLATSDEKQSKLLSRPIEEQVDNSPRAAMNTWEISFKSIKKKNLKSCALLQIMALLDFQGIPKELLDSANIRSRLGLQDSIDFDNAMQPLLAFSLVQRAWEGESKNYRLHRLVSLWTRWNMPDKLESIAFVLQLIVESYPKPGPTTLQACNQYLPQAVVVLSHSTDMEDPRVMSRRMDLEFTVGKHHYEAWRLEAAETFLRRCHNYYLTLGGTSRVYSSAHCLGGVFQGQGRYEEALKWYERALVGCEKTLGKDHPSTLDTVNNMAIVFQSQGRYEEALKWYERALTGREKTLGKDHPSTLQTANNMANVLRNQGPV